MWETTTDTVDGSTQTLWMDQCTVWRTGSIKTNMEFKKIKMNNEDNKIKTEYKNEQGGGTEQ